MDTLVMPSCSHQCHGGQGGKRIPEVPLTRARVNPRPSSCVTFLSMVELHASWDMVCLEGSPLGLRTSKAAGWTSEASRLGAGHCLYRAPHRRQERG